MRARDTLIFCLLFNTVVVADVALDPNHPKYGPASSPIAVPLSQDHRYFQSINHPAPDFWILNSFYYPQFNEYSCSVAAVAAVINGFIRAGNNLKDADKNVVMDDLLSKVKVEHWYAKTHKGGYKGKLGLTLAELKNVMEATLKAYGVKSAEVKMVEVSKSDEPTLLAYRQTLQENEKSASDFVMMHFVQDALTKAQGGPFAHISPVGAYDQEAKRVLILDVDRDYYQPYWVSDENALKAMAQKTKEFGYGGYLHIVGKK